MGESEIMTQRSGRLKEKKIWTQPGTAWLIRVSMPENGKWEVGKQKQIKRQRESPEIYSVPRDRRENHPPEAEEKSGKERRDSFKGQLSPVFPCKTVKDAIFFFLIRQCERKVESYRS